MLRSARTRRGRWDWREVLYDLVLERPLAGIRRAVGKLAAEAGFYPLLDIGCGPGNQLRRLAANRRPEDPPCVGLDINPRALAYAAGRGPGARFVHGEATELPFRPGAFRGVILSFALHEQEPEVRRRMLAAAGEVLGPEGRLVLVDFENPWNPVSRLAYGYISVIERIAGRDHFRRNRDFHRRGGLRALLAESGLVEIRRRDLAAGTCAIVLAVFSDEPARSFQLQKGP